MACPKCGCKETYQYDDEEGSWTNLDDPWFERCAACGHVFYFEDHTEEDDDEA